MSFCTSDPRLKFLTNYYEEYRKENPPKLQDYIEENVLLYPISTPPPPNTQTTNTHTHTRTRHFFNDLAPSPSNFSYPASNTLFAHTPHLYIAHSWLIKKKKGQQILLAHNQNNNYVFLNKFVFVGLFNLKKPTTKNSQLWAMYTPTPPQRLKFWKHCEEYGKEIH